MSREIMSIFRELNREKGLTILLVTHEAEVAAYAERIVTFRDGRVVEDNRYGRKLPLGPPQTLVIENDHDPSAVAECVTNAAV